MEAGEFAPTAHSKVTYNEAFRANQYTGIGAIPIYQLGNSIQLRGEFYGFIPIFPIKKMNTEKHIMVKPSQNSNI